MLFNKANQGIAEVKKHLGFIYASNSFSNIATEITLAQEQLQKITGTAVMLAAQDHYNSANYQLASPSAEQKTLDNLVDFLQLPIALYAYLDYAPSKDLIHDNLGRRAAYEENTQIAREWQINASESSIRNRANRAVDRVLEFLDASALTAWTESDQFLQARALFLHNADSFQKYHPIDYSRRFYIMAMPFIQSAETDHILPILGQAEYDRLKEQWQSREAAPEDAQLIESIIQPALAALAMMQTLQKLSVKALPDGIVQAYTSDRQTLKASQTANIFDRVGAIQTLRTEANSHIMRLVEYIRHKNALANPVTTSPIVTDTTKKFFRV